MLSLTLEEIDWSLSSPNVDRAAALFMEGYNCCQSVFAAFAPCFGIPEQNALKLSCSLGAGIGRMREVCGTVSAMALIVSLCNGNTDPQNTDAKEENYRTVRMLSDLFRQKHETILCRELLGLSQAEPQARPLERTSAYYAARPCPSLVTDAALILEHYLKKAQI